MRVLAGIRPTHHAPQKFPFGVACRPLVYSTETGFCELDGMVDSVHERQYDANVYGASTWDATLDGTYQRDLRVWDGQPGTSTSLSVDRLDLAQLVYLMMDRRRVADLIDSLALKFVLVLGRFSEERIPRRCPRFAEGRGVCSHRF